VIRQLAAALSADVDVMGAGTWEDAVERLSAAAPDLIVLCYVFDEMRPYRFVQHVRGSERRRTPILLIRAVTVPLGATLESDLRRSYSELGVNDFLNFSDLANEHGLDHALGTFAQVVNSLLPRRAAKDRSGDE
jgi:PleD family two-component response regulator